MILEIQWKKQLNLKNCMFLYFRELEKRDISVKILMGEIYYLFKVFRNSNDDRVSQKNQKKMAKNRILLYDKK